MPRPSSVLPIAYLALRILILLNWLMGVAILVLLFLMPTREWIMSSLALSPSPEAERVIFGLRAVAMIGLVTIPINHLILARLLAIVASVREGDPFIALNAVRLQTIAWALLALQLLGLAVGFIARGISSPDHPVKLDAGFSVTGWLAVLLAFVLAGVFAQGASMRDELEGTV